MQLANWRGPQAKYTLPWSEEPERLFPASVDQALAESGEPSPQAGLPRLRAASCKVAPKQS